MKDLTKKKLGSRKFLIVLWACLLLTFWGTYSLVNAVSQPWMAGVLALLAGIPTAYVAVKALRQPTEGK